MRGRLDGKYLPELERDDPGFDPGVFVECRQRLLAGNEERRIFDLPRIAQSVGNTNPIGRFFRAIPTFGFKHEQASI